MNRHWLFPLPLALAGLALGFFGADHGTTNQNAHPRKLLEKPRAQPEPNAVMVPPDPPLTLIQSVRLACLEVSGPHRMHALVELFRSSSIEDLRAVAELVLELPEPQRKPALLALMTRWSELDPAEAVQFAANHRRASELYALPLAVYAWTRADLAAAAQWTQQKGLFREPDLVWTLGNALGQAAHSDPGKAVDILLALEGERWTSQFATVFGEWAKDDPKAAIARALGLENVKRRSAAVGSALSAWVESDSLGAFAWFQQLSDDRLRQEVAPGLITGLAKSAPDSALELARSLPPGAREKGVTAVAKALYLTDLEAAKIVVEEVPFQTTNGELQHFYFQWMMGGDSGAAMQALLERVRKNPGEAAAIEEFLTQSVAPIGLEGRAAALATVEDAAPDDFRRRLLENTARTWASRDVTAARAWAEALPEGAARNRALAGVAAGWMWHSISEATQWLDSLPPSDGRDAAIGGFASNALPRDPAGALAWMNTIGNAGLRATILQNAWHEWVKRDAEKAAEWRDSSPDLSPSQRASLK